MVSELVLSWLVLHQIQLALIPQDLLLVLHLQELDSYFTGLGTSNYHSIKTNRDSVIGEVSKNIVSVETETPHGLAVEDEVDISITTGLSTSVSVIYNEYNKRIVFNPRSFVAAAVSTTDNTIEHPTTDSLVGKR